MTNSLRNVALVAHVDHGKTTLVDTLLRSTGAFASHAAVIDRVMDSDDQERERDDNQDGRQAGSSRTVEA